MRGKRPDGGNHLIRRSESRKGTLTAAIVDQIPVLGISVDKCITTAARVHHPRLAMVEAGKPEQCQSSLDRPAGGPRQSRQHRRQPARRHHPVRGRRQRRPVAPWPHAGRRDLPLRRQPRRAGRRAPRPGGELLRFGMGGGDVRAEGRPSALREHPVTPPRGLTLTPGGRDLSSGPGGRTRGWRLRKMIPVLDPKGSPTLIDLHDGLDGCGQPRRGQEPGRGHDHADGDAILTGGVS
jgi:hypothetical protein